MMHSEEADIDLIERYLRNKLSADELATVYQRLKDDAAFAEKIEDYKDIIQGIKLMGVESLRNDLAGWEDELREEDRKIQAENVVKKIQRDSKDSKPGKQINMPSDSWKKYLSLAAGLLLTIAAAVYLFNSNNTRTPEEIFAAHFSPYEELLSTRSEQRHATLDQALNAYNQKKYEEAVSSFDSYLQTSPEDYDARFYLGISQLAIGRHAEAISSFDMVISRNTVFKDSAEWYRALAFIQMNDLAEAKKQLHAIVQNSGHDYRQRAEALLQDLD